MPPNSAAIEEKTAARIVLPAPQALMRRRLSATSASTSSKRRSISLKRSLIASWMALFEAHVDAHAMDCRVTAALISPTSWRISLIAISSHATRSVRISVLRGFSPSTIARPSQIKTAPAVP